MAKFEGPTTEKEFLGTGAEDRAREVKGGESAAMGTEAGFAATGSSRMDL
jgi:hypothetical protein